MILSNVGISDALDHLMKALGSIRTTMAYIGAMSIRNYLPQFTAEEMLELARGLDDLLETKMNVAAEARAVTFATPRDPEKRLRIGFVSGDLGNHPVGTFLRSTITSFDRQHFELVAYATQVREKESLEPLFDLWRPVHDLDSQQFVATVREDAPDILVDLAGFTSANRLWHFARRLAPLQVTWLGYSGTRCSRDGHILADRWIIPETRSISIAEGLADETVTSAGYRPLMTSGRPLPALANGYVTFGCFNNIRKISDDRRNVDECPQGHPQQQAVAQGGDGRAGRHEKGDEPVPRGGSAA